MAGGKKTIQLESKFGDIGWYPMLAATTLYRGQKVAVNTGGLAIGAAHNATIIRAFVGIAMETVVNSGGDADKAVKVWRRGEFAMKISGAAQTSVGLVAYCAVGQTDAVDETIATSTGGLTATVGCGLVVRYESASKVWVDITSATVLSGTDLTSHLGDSADAHDASAISVLDSGTFTAATEVEAALAELYQNAITIQGFIPVPLTTLMESDATNVVDYLGKATTPILDMTTGDTDSGLTLEWALSENDAVIFQTPLPPNLLDTADLILHVRAYMGGTSDTPVIDIDTYFNEGDTKVSDATAAITGVTPAEYIATIGNADVPTGAQTITIELTPAAHTTDSLFVSAIWLEYKTKLNAS